MTKLTVVVATLRTRLESTPAAVRQSVLYSPSCKTCFFKREMSPRICLRLKNKTLNCIEEFSSPQLITGYVLSFSASYELRNAVYSPGYWLDKEKLELCILPSIVQTGPWTLYTFLPKVYRGRYIALLGC
jgi:hypothetical protein